MAAVRVICDGVEQVVNSLEGTEINQMNDPNTVACFKSIALVDANGIARKLTLDIDDFTNEAWVGPDCFTPPTPRISGATSARELSSVTLVGSATTIEDSGVSNIRYAWEDGSTNPTRTVNEPVGTNTYILTVIYDTEISCDRQVQTTHTVTWVANQGPSVNIVGPTSGELGSSVTLTAIATDSDGTIQSYGWSTGATTQSITVPCSSVGTTSYSVTVADDLGATASDSHSVTCVDSRPVFSFGNAGASCSVTESGTVSVSVNQGTVTSFSPTSFGPVLQPTQRTVSVSVRVPAGYQNTGSIVSGNTSCIQGSTAAAFTYADAGVTCSVATNGDITVNASQGTIASFTPARFDAVTTDTQRTINVSVTVPAGFSNSGQQVSGTCSTTQHAQLQAFAYSDATVACSISDAGTATVTATYNGQDILSSFTPAVFDTVDRDTSRDISVSIIVPAGFSNSGDTLTGICTTTQPAVVPTDPAVESVDFNFNFLESRSGTNVRARFVVNLTLTVTLDQPVDQDTLLAINAFANRNVPNNADWTYRGISLTQTINSITIPAGSRTGSVTVYSGGGSVPSSVSGGGIAQAPAEGEAVTYEASIASIGNSALEPGTTIANYQPPFGSRPTASITGHWTYANPPQRL